MHYVICRSERIQKHNVDIMCPDALFVVFVPAPLEHDKYCIDVSSPGCTIMYYVTHTYHRKQKHKFNITCSSELVWYLRRAKPSMQNSASTSHAPNIPKCTT
jgi:hypothetical protein